MLARWCVKSPEIHEFFSVIKKDMGMVRSTTGQSAGHAGLDKVSLFFEFLIGINHVRFYYIVFTVIFLLF